MMQFSPTRVTCYSGYKADEAPRAFEAGDGLMMVVEVLEMWLERSVKDDTSIRYFRVMGGDGIKYLLRHEEQGGGWSYTRLRSQNHQ